MNKNLSLVGVNSEDTNKPVSGIFLTMGQVQQRICDLTNTEWTKLKNENKDSGLLKERNTGKQLVACLEISRLPEFREKLRELRARKKRLQEESNSPQALAEKQERYRRNRVFYMG